MLKYRLYFNKDKACAWINSMADDGWALKGFGAGFWRFVPCTPGMYRYAMDFEAFSGRSEGEYTDFMDTLGVTTVGRWGPWVVLRQPASEGPLELYTDSASAIEQRRRILAFFKIVCVVELICLITLCLVLPEMDYAWGVILAIGAAGVFTLIFANRCFQLKEEILMLQSGPECQRPGVLSRPARLLIATGLAVMLSGLLLKQGQTAQDVGQFLMGFGVGLEGVGLFIGVLGR